jgi:hypothetical protein
MSHEPSSPLGKLQGPDGSAGKFDRQARAFVKAGGAILLKYQMEKLSPKARSEVEALMRQAYGKCV